MHRYIAAGPENPLGIVGTEDCRQRLFCISLLHIVQCCIGAICYFGIVVLMGVMGGMGVIVVTGIVVIVRLIGILVGMNVAVVVIQILCVGIRGGEGRNV